MASNLKEIKNCQRSCMGSSIDFDGNDKRNRSNVPKGDVETYTIVSGGENLSER